VIEHWNVPDSSEGSIVGAFLVVGDWGLDLASGEHGSFNGYANDNECVQTAIGGMMSQFIDNPAHGHAKSVVVIGDNFYSRGLNSSGMQYRTNMNGWNVVWRERMGRSAQEDVAWYSVYGNHDMGQMDSCICGSQGNIDKAPQNCNQIIGHKNADASKGGKNWYMPHLMYSVSKDGAVGPDGRSTLPNSSPPNDDLAAMPEVELVALETNYADVGMICNDGPRYGTPDEWKTWCPDGKCSSYLTGISSQQAAVSHLQARIKADPNKLRIVFNHYPAVFDALQEHTSSPGQQEWFGGHTHQNIPLGPNGNGNNWMVGGSGGWGLEGGLSLDKAGFAVVFVMEKGGKRHLTTKLQNLDDQGNYNPFQKTSDKQPADSGVEQIVV